MAGCNNASQTEENCVEYWQLEVVYGRHLLYPTCHRSVLAGLEAPPGLANHHTRYVDDPSDEWSLEPSQVPVVHVGISPVWCLGGDRHIQVTLNCCFWL